MAFFAGSSRLVMLVIFVSYVYLSEIVILTPESVFSSLALLNVVKLSFALFFPSGVSQLSEAKASVQRIQAFLLSDEKMDSKESGFYVREETGSQGVYFQKVDCLEVKITIFSEYKIIIQRSFKSNFTDVAISVKTLQGRWLMENSDQEPTDTLKNLSFQVSKGKLFAVIGSVGSGKVSHNVLSDH